jgi:two-component system, sensor histidine kinase and response regulator
VNKKVYLHFFSCDMKRPVVILILLLAFCSNTVRAGWQENADSLKNLLQQANTDTTKMRLYIELGAEVLSNTPEAAFDYYTTAQKLAEKDSDTNYIVRSMLGICGFYSRVNEYSTSLEIVYKALEMSKSNTKLLAMCYSWLAELHHMIEEYDVALQHNHTALTYDKLNNDSTRMAVDYHNMGTLFLEKDIYDSALYFLKMANTIYIKQKGKPSTFSLSHIGLTFTYMEKYDSALYYHFQSLKYDSMDARKYEIAVDYYYIALTYFDMGKFNEAEVYALKSNTFSSELKLFDVLELNYELLYQISEKQNDYKSAYQYALLRNNFADSLRDKSKESLIQSLNAKYKFKENEQQLARVEEKNSLLERQRTLLVILSIVTLLLLVSTVIIINQINRRQKATHELLAELEKANLSKERLISILSHDLRGSIGTLRNAVELIIDDSMDYESIKDLMQSFFPVVDSTYDLLENLLTWAKYSKENLEPFFEQVNIKNLVERSIMHTSHLAISKNITIENQVDDTIVMADKNMLSTVIRNFISNAVKFSYPKSTVTISCAASSTNVEVKISDSGIGMKEDVLKNIFTTPVDYHTKGTMGERGSGLGLSICKSFIEKQGGEIWAESSQGKGSSFYFTIPVA